MDPRYAKAVVLVAAAAIGLIRATQTRTRPAATISVRHGGARDAVALIASFIGFVVPILWTVTPLLAFADYDLRAATLGIGTVGLAVSLWLFHRTHADLGANWSARLQLITSHKLVTCGIYRRIRHPMYLSLLLYGLSQAAVIPNWIAGPSCLVGTAVLFALRVGPEERMMRQRFGAEYDAYVVRSWRLIPGVW